jgi:hypothetical protein
MSAMHRSRSHTGRVILILGVAAIVVASAGGAILWSAYRGSPREGNSAREARGRRDAARDSTRRGEGSADAPRRGSGGRIDCGRVTPWDADGDGISDSLERSNGSFHAFDPSRCDRDPTIAEGSPSRGSLRQGVKLADEGDGYLHVRGTDPPDADDWA